MEARLRARSASADGQCEDGDDDDFDADEESDGNGDTECPARPEFADELLVRRERDLVERERAVAKREKDALTRETSISAKQEPTAAEALREDAGFRLSVYGQIARLIDDLVSLPPRLAQKVLSDDDLALFEAVLDETED